MSKLVNDLIRNGYLKSGRVIDAFSEIGRVEFVPDEFRLQAEANIALPIGYGRTILNPLLAAMMFDLLDPGEGQRILDVSPGSGWTTALFAYVVGEKGQVVVLEKNAELKKMGEYNVDKFGYIKKGIVKLLSEDENIAKESDATFDRILISLGAKESLDGLKGQLKLGGKMVALIHDNMTYFERKSETEFFEEKYAGFSSTTPFVD
jgi:protein-L-isoaspartate(D-aspartate) O-methyltransferase